MNYVQIRAIKNSFQRDEIYRKGSGYNNNLLETGIMGKNISDVQFVNKENKLRSMYTLTKGKNVYRLLTSMNERARDIYVITLNEIVIYWVISNIFCEASDAFHALTEVYHRYRDNTSSWQWVSKEDFECINDTWIVDKMSKTLLTAILPNITEYQKKRLKDGVFVIDKKIDPSLNEKEYLTKFYYHL